MIHDTPVWISNMGGDQGEGLVRIEVFSTAQRVVRALKLGGICWLAAIGAVFLPIIHFILVPSLLLAGPVIAGWQWSCRERIVDGEGVCPSCQAKLPIAGGTVRWPLAESCPECNRGLQIVRR